MCTYREETSPVLRTLAPDAKDNNPLVNMANERKEVVDPLLERAEEINSALQCFFQAWEQCDQEGMDEYAQQLIALQVRPLRLLEFYAKRAYSTGFAIEILRLWATYVHTCSTMEWFEAIHWLKQKQRLMPLLANYDIFMHHAMKYLEASIKPYDAKPPTE